MRDTAEWVLRSIKGSVLPTFLGLKKPATTQYLKSSEKKGSQPKRGKGPGQRDAGLAFRGMSHVGEYRYLKKGDSGKIRMPHGWTFFLGFLHLRLCANCSLCHSSESKRLLVPGLMHFLVLYKGMASETSLSSLNVPLRVGMHSGTVEEGMENACLEIK